MASVSVNIDQVRRIEADSEIVTIWFKKGEPLRLPRAEVDIEELERQLAMKAKMKEAP